MAHTRLTRNTALLVIFLVALGLLTWDINAPFVRQGCYDEIIYTLHARAFDRYGFIKTRLALVYPPGDPAVPLSIDNPATSRSVLLTVLLTLVYKALGYREWAGRLIGIASTLISLLALYGLSRRLWTQRVALIATLVMALTPSIVIFGRETWTVAPQMACWLIALWLYVRWLQTEHLPCLWGMAVSLALGILFSPWSGLFLPPFIALHGLIWGGKHRWITIGWSMGAAVVTAVLFAAHMIWLGPVAWQSVFERIALRSGASGVDVSPSAIAWLTKMIWRISGWNTPFAVLFGVVVLFALAYRMIKRKQVALADQVWMILISVGLSIMLVFPQLAWVHHYIAVFTVPGLAVASAVAVDGSLTRMSHNKLALIVVAVLAMGWLAWSIVMIDIQSQYRLKELDVYARLDQSLPPGGRILVAGDVPFTFQFYFKHPWARVELDHEWENESSSGRHVLGLVFFQPGSPVEAQAVSFAAGRVDTDPPLSPSFFVVPLNKQDTSVLVAQLNGIPERASPTALENLIQSTRKALELRLGIRTRLD
jgi:4-amino-4-deoxy-L-arabinose transferase-like glycosyltransferase